MCDYITATQVEEASDLNMLHHNALREMRVLEANAAFDPIINNLNELSLVEGFHGSNQSMSPAMYPQGGYHPPMGSYMAPIPTPPIGGVPMPFMTRDQVQWIQAQYANPTLPYVGVQNVHPLDQLAGAMAPMSPPMLYDPASSSYMVAQLGTFVPPSSHP